MRPPILYSGSANSHRYNPPGCNRLNERPLSSFGWMVAKRDIILVFGVLSGLAVIRRNGFRGLKSEGPIPYARLGS
jgi:hypothetical protein